MKKKNNEAIREAARKKHLFLWEVAMMLGISDQTLCRKMRVELPEDEQKKIIALIEAYEDKR